MKKAYMRSLLSIALVTFALVSCSNKGGSIIKVGDELSDARSKIEALGGNIPANTIEFTATSGDKKANEGHNVFLLKGHQITIVSVDGKIQSIRMDSDKDKQIIVMLLDLNKL